MKLLNGEIFAANKPLESLSKEKLPIKSSYRIVKLLKEFASNLEIIEKLRIGLIQKYGVKDEKDNYSIKPDTEAWFKFMEEMNILFAQEIEIDFEKIELPSEVDGKVFCIEPEILKSLDKFVSVNIE